MRQTVRELPPRLVAAAVLLALFAAMLARPEGPNSSNRQVFVYSGEVGLTIEDANNIPHSLPNVSRVLPTYARFMTIRSDGTMLEALVMAEKDEFPRAEMSGLAVWPLEQGAYITESDDALGERVAVIGATVRDRLFGSDMVAVGKEILIKGESFRIKGVLADHPEFRGVDLRDPEEMAIMASNRLYVPFETGADLLFRDTKLSHMRVAVQDEGRLDETVSNIRSHLGKRHGHGLMLDVVDVPASDARVTEYGE